MQYFDENMSNSSKVLVTVPANGAITSNKETFAYDDGVMLSFCFADAQKDGVNSSMTGAEAASSLSYTLSNLNRMTGAQGRAFTGVSAEDAGTADVNGATMKIAKGTLDGSKGGIPFVGYYYVDDSCVFACWAVQDKLVGERTASDADLEKLVKTATGSFKVFE